MTLLLCALLCADHPIPEIDCGVLVVGASLGGVAAALALQGTDAWVIEPGPWPGGQITSQGVSALDEHRHIESFGGTRLYMELRRRLREASGGAMNPGGGWVSRLCFEPLVALRVLREWLEGTRILYHHVVIRVDWRADRIARVWVRGPADTLVGFCPRFVLDATDLGDFLEVAGVPFRIGSESRAETGEPHAETEANPARVQSYTFSFIVEWDPSRRSESVPPADYERLRAEQPYSLNHWYAGRGYVRYGMRQRREGTPGSFFDYRRIGPELALVNWPSNDFRGSSILAREFDAAKRLSLGFLHWLRTECPRDEGGFGYPELHLRADLMGTGDGLSLEPYVREGRRLVAHTLVCEQDLLSKTARARLWPDSVGVGAYGIDVHACSGDADATRQLWIDAKPFQIPLGMLVPRIARNLLAAGKCAGTSQIANGAYRLHPVEWNIGESAARIARFCLERNTDPRDFLRDPPRMRSLQRALLAAGVPIFWLTDLGPFSDEWEGLQDLAIHDEIPWDPETLDLGVSRELRERARRHQSFWKLDAPK